MHIVIMGVEDFFLGGGATTEVGGIFSVRFKDREEDCDQSKQWPVVKYLLGLDSYQMASKITGYATKPDLNVFCLSIHRKGLEISALVNLTSFC